MFDTFGCAAYLLRPETSVPPYKILKISGDSFEWLDELKNSITTKSNDLLWLVAEDDPVSGIVGMVNCLKQEPGGEKIRCIFISPKKSEEKPPKFNFDLSFYQQLLKRDLVMNVWRNGVWGSFRHTMMKDKKETRIVEHSYVDCRKYGDLSSFEWIESRVKYADKGRKELVHIYYSAINFKDVMLASGKISVSTMPKNLEDGNFHNSFLGVEYSGRDQNGKRVAGMTPSSGMATAALVYGHMMIDVPNEWSLEEAATVPAVYVTSYYALVLRGKIQQGQSILIHSATGGIGIAATRIALSYDCEIFVTVGNEQKVKYLKELFPQIKDENIACSRDIEFENMIMKRTNGRGVDLVLNSLADDKFLASIRCVAKHGQFIEIGKYDISLDRKIGLKPFLNNISFHAVMLDQLFEASPQNVKEFQQIMQLVKSGIEKGVVKPLSRTIFKRDEIEGAFRYMAKGIHVGKVLIRIREEEPKKFTAPQPLTLPAIPHTYFYPLKVYIVIGGLGGFGIEVIKWLLAKGGRNIIITSRKGAKHPYQKLCIQRWRNAGYNIQLSTLNVAKYDDAQQLVKEALKIGSIGGIFNSAVVLKDAFLDCQTEEAFKESCAPKADATKILDKISRELCPNLDYFVCFSSISCGKGNAGQTNYGYANSVMERICEQRRNDGFHGLAIQWGIIGDVGLVHRNMGDDAMIAGVRAQNLKSCLDTLDLFCLTKHPVVCSYVTTTTTKRVSQQLNIVSQIAKVLGMDKISETSANKPFGEIGIDSLMGVEIKQLLESHLDTSLTMQEIYDMKINDLKELSKNTPENASSKTSEPSKFTVNELLKLPPILGHKEPIIPLNNLTNGAPVFIINLGNIDQTHFEVLMKNLVAPLFLLNRTKSTPITDIESLTQWYLNLIITQTKGSFHLIGYSIGGLLAYNIALRTEKLLKSVTLLDCSKHFMKVLNNPSDINKIEAFGICQFVEQFSTKLLPELEEELLRHQDSKVKLNIALKVLSSESTNNVEISDAINQYLDLFKLFQSYTINQKLSKDILFVESPTEVLPNDVTEIKSFMSQYCNGKISVQRLMSWKELGNKVLVQLLISLLKNNL